jgi:hypothetical protein
LELLDELHNEVNCVIQTHKQILGNLSFYLSHEIKHRIEELDKRSPGAIPEYKGSGGFICTAYGGKRFGSVVCAEVISNLKIIAECLEKYIIPFNKKILTKSETVLRIIGSAFMKLTAEARNGDEDGLKPEKLKTILENS